MTDRSAAAWRRPDANAPEPVIVSSPPPEPTEPIDVEATRTFTDADLAALRALLRDDATRKRPAPASKRPATSHRAPPNLGPWLALVLIVLVLAAAAVGSLTLWLYLR